MSEIILRNPNDLALHPLLKSQPWMEEGQFEVFRVSIREQGVLQPLMVTEGDEVVDGRHRWKGARLEHVTAVPCMVVGADQVASIILTTILDRRHYSKSARAYLALPLFKQAREEGLARRAGNLKKGGSSRNPTKLGFGESVKNGVEEFAEKLGISAELFRQAREIEDNLFAPQDQVIADWLAEDEEMRAGWEAWRDAHPANGQPWRCWRASRLAEMGENPDAPHTIHVIPENYRETYEQMIFADEISLGGVIQAMKGKLSTKGKPRGDTTEDPVRVYTQTLNRVKQMTGTFFGRWEVMPEKNQGEIAKEMARVAAQEWPESVRRLVFLSLREVLK